LDSDGSLYYYPRPAERIETVQCVAPGTEKLILIKGVPGSEKNPSFISFQNVSFQASSYNLPKGGFEPSQAASQVGAAIEIDFADHIRFQNCEVAHTGANAIWFRRACSDSEVIHCNLHDLGAGGIKIGESVIRENEAEITHHIRVENSILQSGGAFLPCAAALIIFSAHDNEVINNDIGDFGYTGISVGWVYGYGNSPAKRNRIEYNHIHHLGWGLLSDMAGVYTLGPSEGTTVSNNVIHDVVANEYGGWGLYTDEGSTGIIMENNLVFRCKDAGFHQHFGKDNIIRNNIFALNSKAQLQLSRVEQHRSLTFENNIVYSDRNDLFATNWTSANIDSDYNCYWIKGAPVIMFGKSTFQEWQKGGKDVHSIIADPGFQDPLKFDFRIKNQNNASLIKFKSFDYSRAGVYGSTEWKNKAKLKSDEVKDFNLLIMN
jgi:hypothetical protein